MSRHYLVLVNGPIEPRFIDTITHLDPGEPFLHAVVPSVSPPNDDLVVWGAGGPSDVVIDPVGRLARWRLRIAIQQFQMAGMEVHGDIGPADPVAAVAKLRSQGWPYAGLLLTAALDDPNRWLDVDLTALVDAEVPLLAVGPREHIFAA